MESTDIHPNLKRALIGLLFPGADTLPALALRVCDQTEQLLVRAQIDGRLDVPTQIPDVALGAGFRNAALFATKEAVTNAIRHARTRTVMLRVGFEWRTKARTPPGS